MRSISELITPDSVTAVNTVRCEFPARLRRVDLKQIRIERLTQYAKAREVLDDPARLGALIGKKPNQVYNLLHGVSSFGEKVARSIEEAAGLPRYWLDLDEVNAESPRGELPPDVAAAAAQIAALPPRHRTWMLQVVRDALEGLELAKSDLLQSGNASPTNEHPPSRKRATG